MAGYKHDRKPFDEEQEVNPSSNPSHYSHSKLPEIAPEPATYNYDRNPVVDIALDKAASLRQKERELQAEDAELGGEEEIRKKEEALAKAGVFLDVKNWPPFYPVIHLDIANEIPDYLHRMVYVAFATFLGLVLCLFWNILAVSIAAIKFKDGSNSVGSWFLGIIFFILGVPGAYFLWYRPLYRTCRKNNAFRFGWIFIFYSIHVLFCILCAIAPPIFFEGLSFPGFMSAMYAFSSSAFVGILYFVGFGLMCTETTLSIWVFEALLNMAISSGLAAEARHSAAATGRAMAA